MKLYDLLDGVEYEQLQGGNAEITNICMDTRGVTSGALFVCIKGANIDRHDYIDEVAEHGASAVIVERDVECADRELAIIKVNNPRIALCYIAANFYQHPDRSFRLTGVTGTKGKTSTTYFLQSVLRSNGRQAGIIGTTGIHFNDDVLNIPFATSSTPDTTELMLAFDEMRRLAADDVIMEVSSHALDLHKTDGVRFKVGIFTNLTQDHLDYHKTMENYLLAKSRLFSLCEHGIINADDKVSEIIAKNATCKILTFGIYNDCDIRAVDIIYKRDGVSFKASINGQEVPFTIPVPGRFNVYNSLGVIAAAICLDVPVPVIQRGLAELVPAAGRFQTIPNTRGFSIIVDYAHTPDSLLNVLQTVREFTDGKVITVFGCGGDKDRTKRPIMGSIAGELSDYVVLTSDNPRSEVPISIIKEIEKGIPESACPYVKHEDRKEAIYAAIRMAQPGDSVIIAGKGHETYQEFADETIHFDDVEVTKEVLEGLE